MREDELFATGLNPTVHSGLSQRWIFICSRHTCVDTLIALRHLLRGKKKRNKVKSILLYNRFAPSGFTRRIDECLLHFHCRVQTPVVCWNIFQSLPLPVKCCRLKLIVRANHLYSPLTRGPGEKMWPSDTDGTCVPLRRKRKNILVCKAPLPWIISALPPPLSLSYSGLFSRTMQILVLWRASRLEGRNCPFCEPARARVRMYRRREGRIPPLVPVLAAERQRQKP